MSPVVSASKSLLTPHSVPPATEAAVPATATHAALAALQASTALLPDYGFARAADAPPDARGTSVAGLVGGALTLVVALGLAWIVRRRGPRR